MYFLPLSGCALFVVFFFWQIKINKIKETESKASKLEGVFCNLTKNNNKLYIFLVNKEES